MKNTLYISNIEYKYNNNLDYESNASVTIQEFNEFNIFVKAHGVNIDCNPNCDNWILMACLFPAMEFCDSIYIDGIVDEEIIVNLTELNVVWNSWRPDKYKIISIEAKEVINKKYHPLKKSNGHLFAYSGGVDAMATLLRHRYLIEGWRKREISAAIVVHGLDMLLDKESDFITVLYSAKRSLDSADVNIITVKTNIRSLPINWEDSCGLSLAAVAASMGGGYAGVVFGSDSRDYQSPVIPWGSNPIIDRFYNTKRFEVFTDGCELSRIDKIKLVLNYPKFSEEIRVCWQPNSGGRNCCRCEKCLRTQAMMLACGLSIPSCFNEKANAKLIKNIELKNGIHLRSWSEILDVAKCNGINDEWLLSVQKILNNFNKKRKITLIKKIINKIKKYFDV